MTQIDRKALDAAINYFRGGPIKGVTDPLSVVLAAAEAYLKTPGPPMWTLWLWRRDREGQDGPYFYNSYADLMKSMQSFEPKAVIKVQIEAPPP